MILEQIRAKLKILTDERRIDDQQITITCKALTPEEAIGNPLHDDYPIQLGKERLIEAEFMGRKGQAFSDSYFNYKGSVKDILSLKLDTNARRAIFVSSLNAILAGLGEMPEALHCKNDDLTRCGNYFAAFLADAMPEANKALLVGLQPRLLETLVREKRQVRVCDLNPDNIGAVKCGVTVDGPERFSESARWADAIFATAYYKEDRRGHGIFDLLKLNIPNNHSRKEKKPCPEMIITDRRHAVKESGKRPSSLGSTSAMPSTQWGL